MRLFSFQNLVETLICRELNKFNTSGDRIKKVLGYLQRKKIIESEIKYFEQRKEWESSQGTWIKPKPIDPGWKCNMLVITIEENTLNLKIWDYETIESFYLDLKGAIVINIFNLIEEAKRR